MKNLMKVVAMAGAVLIACLGAVLAMALPANASVGSDYPDNRPFWFESDGVHFSTPIPANGHFNSNLGNIHFDPNNNQPGTPFIGLTLLPYSAIGAEPGECFNWAQSSREDYHFGENNENRQGGIDERGWTWCIPTEEPPVEEPPFVVTEVCAWWKVLDTDGNGDIWEQVLLSKDCAYTPVAECEDITIQFDKYWIRDAADQAKYDAFLYLHEGDDYSLDPHDYFVRDVAAKDCTVIPEKPEPIVEVSSVNETDCEALEVITTTTTITTDWVLDGKVWVKSAPVTTIVDTSVPAMLEECPPPTKPEPIVEVEEKQVKDCDAETITTVITTTTTNWVLDGRTWVQDKPVVTITSSEVATTADDCPVVDEPPVETPKPVVTTLQATGIDPPWIAGGLALLVVIAGGVMLARRRA